MKKWNERSPEVAHLLNPAFCGRLLYAAIQSYETTANRSFPFPLIYLVLPLVLHKGTREKINSQTKFLIWTQNNSELLISMAKRARNLIQITNEAIEFLLQTGRLAITQNGELEVKKDQRPLSSTKFADNEVKECIKKSAHIGRWFARTGRIETIYISLGVRP